MKNVDAVVAQIRASALALSGLADALEGKEVKKDEVKKSDEVKKDDVKKSDEVKKDEVKKSDEVKEEAKEENEPEKSYTFEEVRTLLTLKSREGKTEAVRDMLLAHGATTLSALKKEDYAEVMKEAEGL